jgi:hypothetical protein
LVVEGGNARQFVVESAGVAPGEDGVAGDGVLADPGQAAGLPDAAAAGQVGRYGDGPVVGQAAAEQGRPLPLGEPGFARPAIQQAALVLAVPGTDGQVAAAALAVGGALGPLAAEPAQVIVHGAGPGKSEVSHHRK